MRSLKVINDSLKLGMDNEEGYDWKRDFEERFKPRLETRFQRLGAY